MNNGKGDSPRNCFSQHYRENYDQIFNTITGEDWRREIQRGRKTKNKVRINPANEKLWGAQLKRCGGHRL